MTEAQDRAKRARAAWLIFLFGAIPIAVVLLVVCGAVALVRAVLGR